VSVSRGSDELRCHVKCECGVPYSPGPCNTYNVDLCQPALAIDAPRHGTHIHSRRKKVGELDTKLKVAVQDKVASTQVRGWI